jgi:glycosidase
MMKKFRNLADFDKLLTRLHERGIKHSPFIFSSLKIFHTGYRQSCFVQLLEGSCLYGRKALLVGLWLYLQIILPF